jgi:hypothetical protein
VHGASIGGGGGGGGERQLLRALEGVGSGAEPWPQLRCVCARREAPCPVGDGRVLRADGCQVWEVVWRELGPAVPAKRRARRPYPRAAAPQTHGPSGTARRCRSSRRRRRGSRGALPRSVLGVGWGRYICQHRPTGSAATGCGPPLADGHGRARGWAWVSAAGPRLGRRSGARARALARRVAVRQRRGGGVAGDRARLPAREQGVLHAAQRRRPHRRGLRRAVPAPGGGGEPWD